MYATLSKNLLVSTCTYLFSDLRTAHEAFMMTLYSTVRDNEVYYISIANSEFLQTCLHYFPKLNAINLWNVMTAHCKYVTALLE